MCIRDSSVDDWGFAGLPLEKATDTPDPKKPPRSMFIRPVAYPVNARAGILVGDANATPSLYPRVYIASGKAVPAKAPEGKVIHVPYTDLLNADGTPKAAKDLWTILVKAGVPRYAEIVSFSEEPGEAAVSYFIMKLMGYPDVKVLVL